jgi:hypothetical protein
MNALIVSATDHNSLQLWEFLEVWLEFGAMPPVDIVYTETESPRNPVKRMTVQYKVPVHSMYRNRIHVIKSGFTCWNVSVNEIMNRLGTWKGVGLADLVKYHRPPNAAILLRYIDRNLAFVRGKMSEQTCLEEI